MNAIKNSLNTTAISSLTCDRRDSMVLLKNITDGKLRIVEYAITDGKGNIILGYLDAPYEGMSQHA